MVNAGIDYGMGKTNCDHATGIRYGVISQNSVLQAWADSSEADYGDATCPKCGSVATMSSDLPEESEEWEISDGACSDWGCVSCEYVFDASEAYGEEPQGFYYCDDGYECHTAFDNTEIFITKAPFYTTANYCSPCAPGAGDLDSPNDDGAKTYCFGHDWFEEGKAPYRVFRVDNDQEVLPDAQ